MIDDVASVTAPTVGAVCCGHYSHDVLENCCCAVMSLWEYWDVMVGQSGGRMNVGRDDGGYDRRSENENCWACLLVD